MRRRLARFTERDRRMIDRALATAFLVGLELNVVTASHLGGPLALNVVLAAAMAPLVLLRRTRPLLMVIGVAVAVMVDQLFLTSPPDLTVMVLLVIFTVYSVGAYSDQAPALVGVALIVALFLAVAALRHEGDVLFPIGVFVILPWLGGRSLRNHTLLARELAEKADRARLAREEDERRAVQAERAHVARELHDVLAHNLSVMVIHASAARRVVARDPDAAANSAELIRRTGREALDELRQLFGPVRRGDGESLDASPGLANLERLAERTHRAGVPVDLRVEGPPLELPPGVDFAAYRVVQEALTNAIKHAAGARATVIVRYEPGDVVLEVLDDGPGPAGNGSSGEGHGLLGMRERVALYGGRLETGRRRGGGFAVRVRLPVGGALA
jgi:signal transduction histidine kinase